MNASTRRSQRSPRGPSSGEERVRRRGYNIYIQLFFVIGFKFAEGPVRWRASLSRRIARVDSFSSQSSGDLEGELTPTRLRWGANPGFMPTGYKLCPFAVSLFFKSLDRFSVSR
jgi:hypothetical protein